MKKLSGVTLFLVLSFGLSVAAPALALPKGITESRFVNGLTAPTSMAFSPDGRLFVTEQGGKLRVIKNGQLLSSSFLTVSTTSSGERGLLGVTFDPHFATNRYIYIYYTVPGSPAHNRVSRFRAGVSNPDVSESGSEIVILNLDED